MTKQIARITAAGCLLLSLINPAHSGLFSRTYVFEPSKPKLVPNPLFWHLDTRCTIDAKEPSVKLTGVMKKKAGALNGKALKEGASGTVTVKNKEVLHITADKGALIEITNHGKQTVVAVCRL